METAVTHFILLAVISGLTKGRGVLPDELTAAVGGEVMFTTTVTPPEKPFLSVGWTFVLNSEEINIITSTSSNNTGPGYAGRIILNIYTGSLKLMDLTLNDTGEYSITIITDEGHQMTGSTELKIFKRVSDTSIIPSTQLIEGNSVNLTCDGAGSIFTREWMKDGSPLTQTDNMILYDTNRVLSFLSLNRTDSGEYLCKISNPISNDEANYSMIVNYGPENVQITGPSEIIEKQTLTLTCSAASTPSATYTWIPDGTNILYNSSVFSKVTGLFDSGSYTCQALNEITGRTSFAAHPVTISPSPATIAGITVGCLLVVGGAAGGGFYIYKKKTNRNAQP